MNEEIPPSSLTVRPKPADRPAQSGSAWTLRTSRERWHHIDAISWTKAFAVVAGGWALMAWNRFGFQGLDAPRVAVRFVLVGIYAWIGLTALFWIGDRLGRQYVSGAEPSANPATAGPARLMQVTGLAHQPIVIFGVLLQIGQAISIPGVMPAIVIAVFLAWMPAVLAAAVGSLVGQRWIYAAALTVVAYGAWLAIAGRFLFGQLNHLF